jgi:hypothetical protein
MILSSDIGILNKEIFEQIHKDISEIQKMLYSFAKSINSNMKTK